MCKFYYDVSAIINDYKKKNTISYLIKTKNKALFELDKVSTNYKVNIEKISTILFMGIILKLRNYQRKI